MTSRRTFPLSDTLSALVPDDRDTLLLRACVSGRAVATAAWVDWLASGPGLQPTLTERPMLRRLVPLLHHALATHGSAIPPPALAILRAATLWEQQRAERVAAILGEAVDSLRLVGIEPVITKGPALAATVYPRPWLRHCHDLDLLVPAGAARAACAALVAAGFRPQADSAATSVTLAHMDGLPLVLHTRLWSRGKDREGSIHRRLSSAHIGGKSVAVLAPFDMLLHVCGLTPISLGPGNWTWVADAAMILGLHHVTAGDWDELLESAEGFANPLTLAARLGYLAERLELDIPERVLDSLAVRAASASDSEKDEVLVAAQAVSRIRLRAMIRRGNWNSRIELLRAAMRRRRAAGRRA
jgi:hypothetical protein